MTFSRSSEKIGVCRIVTLSEPVSKVFLSVYPSEQPLDLSLIHIYTMSTILYQNNKTGAAFDITTLVTSAKWSTKRSGSPASLEITALWDAAVEWEHGGILTLLDGGAGLFYGYVVKISRSEKEQVSVTAYDQVWYLKKNKETYVFENQRADQILTQIAEDFGLTVGTLENTGYAVPSMVEDGQTLLDIVLKALDYTIINTGRMYAVSYTHLDVYKRQTRA